MAADLPDRLCELLAGRDDIAAAWLFGSRARGTARDSSDVDLAVLLRDDPPETLQGLLLDLQDDLVGALGRPVDLVIMNRASADLVHRVLRDGDLLLECVAARYQALPSVRKDPLDALVGKFEVDPADVDDVIYGR